MAKILVTGGAGFIGSHIVDAYVQAGHEVVAVDNLSTGSRDNLNPSARFVELDIRSDDLAQVFAQERPDVVSHLAAQMDVRRSLREPLLDADVNVLGSINVLECAIQHRAAKFIFASTGGAIYGEPEALPVPETAPARPMCHYGTSKLATEEYIRLYHRLYGLNFTILRFPNVYGPRQNPHGEAGVCAILIGLMMQGQRPTLYGNGRPMRDYVYVGDIARANVLALDRGNGETLNLGSGRGTTVLEVFDAIRELTGFEGEPHLAPSRPGEIDRIYITGTRAADVLGWAPMTDLREGLRHTMEHIKTESL